MRVLFYLKQLPVQLVLCILGVVFFGSLFSEEVVRTLFTASSIIKDILMFVLPLIIFTYLFDALLGLDKRAPLLLALILGSIFISNIVGVLISGGIGCVVLPLLGDGGSMASNMAAGADMGTSLPMDQVHAILPYFDLHLPTLLSPDRAMFIAIIAGLCLNFFKIEKAHTLAKGLHKLITWFLQKTFVSVLPIYVTGFVLKLQYEGALSSLIQGYFQVFILSLSLILSYILLMYYVGSGLRLSKMMEALKNMLPAGLTGFSTMSSAAAMPVTLEACEKNLKDPRLADILIPTTANTHLMGDVLAIPFTGLALLWLKVGIMPDLSQYVFFAVMFAIAKFSCAGVPGGGVLVILPVLHQYLGMDQELITLMTTLYILQDSIFTASNVMGNGAFAMIVERIYRAFTWRQHAPQNAPQSAHPHSSD